LDITDLLAYKFCHSCSHSPSDFFNFLLITENKKDLFATKPYNEVISEIKNLKVERKPQPHINALVLL
jgi:hypothetical protein